MNEVITHASTYKPPYVYGTWKTWYLELHVLHDVHFFLIQESNADLPSEYWQIQKLIKYLKVIYL